MGDKLLEVNNDYRCSSNTQKLTSSQAAIGLAGVVSSLLASEIDSGEINSAYLNRVSEVVTLLDIKFAQL